MRRRGAIQGKSSHHARVRRRAYPTAGSLREPREGTEYGQRGTAQGAGKQEKKAR